MAAFLDALCADVEAGLAEAPVPEPAYCCVLGSRACGKSTLIAAALGGGGAAPAQPPPPTCGLDYSALRAPAPPPLQAPPAPPPHLHRDVLHVFELGGSAAHGAAAAEWLQIPLTPQRLPSAVLVVALDCGRPLELCATAARVLASVRRRVEECCERLARAAAKGGAGGGAAAAAGATPEALHAQAQARLALGFAQRSGQVASAAAAAASPGSGEGGGEGAAEPPQPPPPQPQPLHAFTPAGAAHTLAALPPHPDAARLRRPGAPHSTVLPLPLIVVAARWDLAREAPAPVRRAMLAALRYIALAHGGALVGVAHRERATLAALRAMLLHCAFGSEGRREAVVEGSGGGGGGAPRVPAGADCLEALLAAGGASSAGAELARCDVPFEARLEALAAALREACAGAGVAGGEGGEAGEAGAGDGEGDEELALLYPEPSIDALVAAKEAAAREAREARERERRMGEAEKRAAAAAAAAAAAGAGSA